MATTMTGPQMATSSLTPPNSDHGEDRPWQQNHSHGFVQPHESFAANSPPSSQFDLTHDKSTFPAFGNAQARRMQSADNLTSLRKGDSTFSPSTRTDFKQTRATPAEWPMQNVDEDSKWIHRDKLARIENQELQAAGIFVPRQRAPSKQRRDRSHSRQAHNSEAAEPADTESHATKEAAASHGYAGGFSNIPSWDLRTPEEIAEEEANPYFTSGGHVGGSRIPVARASPAPIPLDYLERGSPATRKLPDVPSEEGILYPAKTRSRSASTTDRAQGGSISAGKRSVTDSSPKKGVPAGGGGRKASISSKTPPSAGRPKTRSGHGNQPSSGGSGTRPSTRSGDISAKQMEGDPPWAFNDYKPDPRLPPDQQLLPTVARRLQQEKMAKEGRFGDVYDKEFRPLNDRALPSRPAELEKSAMEPEPASQDQWPLKVDSGAVRSPSMRQGSYSTMPRIPDKPPGSPLSVHQPGTGLQPQEHMQMQTQAQSQSEGVLPQAEEEKSKGKDKGGCGCCVVM